MEAPLPSTSSGDKGSPDEITVWSAMMTESTWVDGFAGMTTRHRQLVRRSACQSRSRSFGRFGDSLDPDCLPDIDEVRLDDTRMDVRRSAGSMQANDAQSGADWIAIQQGG
jgi:hypothetical protein